ncbi:MAG: hypothetical protein ABIR62_16645, partial [Dokdonella sp.]|uniref:hypothetical protein n=1 Tax=Dokdonella sp. TaxID=2291710 RepID=UPI0032663250
MQSRTARILAALLTIGVFATRAHADLTVYDDALQNGFQDYSYGGGSNFVNTAPVHGGNRSIALTGNAFNALSFFHDPG